MRLGIALPGFVNEDQTFALGTHTLGTSSMDLEHIHEILGTMYLLMTPAVWPPWPRCSERLMWKIISLSF